MKLNPNKKNFRKLQIIVDNFSVLRIKNIRIYMVGQAISLLGDWMQQTAQAWVV